MYFSLALRGPHRSKSFLVKLLEEEFMTHILLLYAVTVVSISETKTVNLIMTLLLIIKIIAQLILMSFKLMCLRLSEVIKQTVIN